MVQEVLDRWRGSSGGRDRKCLGTSGKTGVLDVLDEGTLFLDSLQPKNKILFLV